jgi:hypothetical protein
VKRSGYIQRHVPLRRSSRPIPRRQRPRPMRKGARANLARECARLWGFRVRSAELGRCKLRGHYVRCAGPIDPAHCFGKKAHPGVRFEVWNGWPLCRAHHDHFGTSGPAWTDLLRFEWGADLYAQRYAMACRTAKLDLAAVRRELAA